MTMKMGRRSYEQMTAENIAWLLANTERTLERDHIIAIMEHSVRAEYNVARSETTDRALLIETLGWLKAYGFEDYPNQWQGLIGRIEKQVGTGWEALGATPPS